MAAPTRRAPTGVRGALAHFQTDVTMTRPAAPFTGLGLSALLVAGSLGLGAAGLALMPRTALAQALAPAADPGPFVISDIRVDGLQRISAGTVFTYLPVERGDRLDRASAAESIRALYRTGFFQDVALSRQGDILVVTVRERPAINRITLVGNKDIRTEELMSGLEDIGLAEGETFNR